MTILGWADIGFPGAWDDFIVAVAAVVAALSTIVLSVRVLAKVRVFRFIGRALVGDPFTKWLHHTISGAPLAEQVRAFAENDDRMHADQQQFNVIVEKRLDGLEELVRRLSSGQEEFRDILTAAVDRQTAMAEGLTEGLAAQIDQTEVIESIRGEIREHEARENLRLDSKVDEVKKAVRGETPP